jgi:succinate dehydrogenase / fumarate reductase cytochrome b subunit
VGAASPPRFGAKVAAGTPLRRLKDTSFTNPSERERYVPTVSSCASCQRDSVKTSGIAARFSLSKWRGLSGRIGGLPHRIQRMSAHTMNLVTRLFTTSLGKKFLMAITGVGLFLFVVGHLAGNLQIFIPDGGEAINRYGHFLKSNMEILWGARLGLLVFVAIHIWTSISLTMENRKARTQGYEVKEVVAASYASRTMIWSGAIIAAFVVYHLLHYTALVPDVNLTGENFHTFLDEKGRHDVHRMMIVGFSQPFVCLFYVVAMGLLCTHLSHGVSAMFQSLGIRNEVNDKCIDKFAKIAAIVIFVGYVSIPTAILAGLVR